MLEINLLVPVEVEFDPTDAVQVLRVANAVDRRYMYHHLVVTEEQYHFLFLKYGQDKIWIR